MVKWANERVYPSAKEPQSYSEKVDMPKDKVSIDITMDSQWRATKGHPDCDRAGYWQNGGSELCTLYVTVECGEGEQMCAYKVELELFEENTEEGELGAEVKAMPAWYIPRDQDYVDVSVSYIEH